MLTPKTYRGIIAVTRRGTGFLSNPEFTEDVLIERESLNCALNGDEVEITLGKKVRGRQTGQVTEVLIRAQTEFVGVMSKVDSTLVLVPDDQRCYVKFRLSDPKDAQIGDKAIVRLSRWNNARLDPIADLVEVLGKAGEHEAETRATVIVHGFKTEFPADVLREAEELHKNRAITDAEVALRRDIRDVVTFTIDPDDAKDFDDALSVKKISDDRYEIGVHIADVTHYVRPGMALDAEAKKRGTSVYLVDRTIPMLPEVLSNDICSLRPNEDRLTFSAMFVVDASARIHERWFGRTAINSNKRFTYKTAQDNLDANSGEHIEELTVLRDLARLMRRERENSGAISFETDEVKIALDDKGKPVKVYVKERLETMKMIEDWMLQANREVPDYIKSLSPKDAELPFIYRIHDTPADDRIEDLRIFLKAVGYELGKAGSKIAPGDINKLLAAAKGSPEETVVQMATLRSMAKAIYSHANIGHFSLGFENYTHFTSPIRRYPDMLAHRLLASHIKGKPISKEELESYRRACVTSSEREVAAAEAERESIKYKQIEFLENRIGQTFEGTITGVAEHGIYVAEKESRAEGLLRVANLKDDYYSFDKKHYALVGQRNKKSYRLGDAITVKLYAADPLHRQIDWMLA